MNLARLFGALATLVAVAFVLGSLVSLLTGPVVGANALASIVVVALVVVALVAATVVGARNREWLESAGYW